MLCWPGLEGSGSLRFPREFLERKGSSGYLRLKVEGLGCDLYTQERAAERDFGGSGLQDPACDKVSTLPLTVNPAG